MVREVMAERGWAGKRRRGSQWFGGQMCSMEAAAGGHGGAAVTSEVERDSSKGRTFPLCHPKHRQSRSLMSAQLPQDGFVPANVAGAAPNCSSVVGIEVPLTQANCNRRRAEPSRTWRGPSWSGAKVPGVASTNEFTEQSHLFRGETES